VAIDAAAPPADSRERLRLLLDEPTTFPLPGAANALTARLIEEAGFGAVYVSGAGIANTTYAVPDIGLTTLGDVVSHVLAIRQATSLPLIVDADTGFGNEINTWNTVRQLERAGADCIQLEDQTFPKRCGHFAGKSVIEQAEMIDKITAASEARSGSGVMILARTDSRAVHGLADACRRANAYAEAGADIVFIEGPETIREIEIIAEEVPSPRILNIVEGGVTPAVELDVLTSLGYTAALFANLTLLASIKAVRDCLHDLRTGDSGKVAIATWDERQALVRKPWYDSLADRFAH
jgi:2-methylisocitrate lyase-like PEP mutase family enzyme